ncbi:MAG: TIGR04083 family peptide-modifying radical SAM enzyme, partial [Methanofollis sp.]|nr:TIGR04083 family peptide-modifying radical SAM enzyme [Methanofollis sp.]
GGEIRGVDPHCLAYARIFEEIGERINKEMFESSPFLEMGGPRSRRARDTKPGVMALIRQMAMR